MVWKALDLLSEKFVRIGAPGALLHLRKNQPRARPRPANVRKASKVITSQFGWVAPEWGVQMIRGPPGNRAELMPALELTFQVSEA
jgi:hypothetical protein